MFLQLEKRLTRPFYQYIATICNNILFEMEFQIEKSYGYRLMEKGFENTCKLQCCPKN